MHTEIKPCVYDTVSVVLDRKWDRNCDIGRFELAYKQPVVSVPPYIGMSMCAEGGAIKKPGWMNAKRNIDSDLMFTPRKDKQVIFNDKLTGNSVETVSKNVGNSRRPQSESNQDEHNCLKPSNSAPVKKSVSRETIDSHPHVKKKTLIQQKSPKIVNNVSVSQSNSNTSINVEKSTSDSISVHTNHQSEQGRLSEHGHHSGRLSDRQSQQSQQGRHSEHAHTEADGTLDDGNVSERGAQKSSPASPLAPKMSMFGSGAIPSTYISNLSSKKIVSRASVSTNYTIPSLDNRDRPALSVNNVETTDLKTLKAQAKGNINNPLSLVNNSSTQTQDILSEYYNLDAFPSQPRRPRRRQLGVPRQGENGQEPKPHSRTRKPEVTIKFPKVPYASINVTFNPDEEKCPKFRYFNLTRSTEDLYRPGPGSATFPIENY